jgi:hypothetical protein
MKILNNILIQGIRTGNLNGIMADHAKTLLGKTLNAKVIETHLKDYRLHKLLHNKD